MINSFNQVLDVGRKDTGVVMNDFDVMMEGLWFFIKIGLMIIAITVIVFSAFVISIFGIGLSELKTGKKF